MAERKTAAELKEQAAKARSDATLDKIEEEAEGRSSVEEAVEERRAELHGDEGAAEGEAAESGGSEDGADASGDADDAEAAGDVAVTPGPGEEGGPEVPASVADQIAQRSYLETDPETGRQYQVRQIRTDVQ